MQVVFLNKVWVVTITKSCICKWISDLDRISLYNINTISSKQVISIRGSLVDPITMVLVLCLIGWETEVNFLNQSLIEVKQNQCNSGLLLPLNWIFSILKLVFIKLQGKDFCSLWCCTLFCFFFFGQFLSSVECVHIELHRSFVFTGEEIKKAT